MNLYFCIVVCLVRSVFGLVHRVFRVGGNTGVDLISFWNTQGLHCGAETESLLRHPIIDQITAQQSCLSNFVFFLDHTSVTNRFTNQSNMHQDIANVFKEMPDFLEPPGREANRTDTLYKSGTGKYQYLRTSLDGTQIYEGIYHDPSDLANSPFIFYSETPLPYDANADPRTVNGFTVGFFRVVLVDKGATNASCELSSPIQNIGSCLASCSAPVTSVDVIYGSNVTLDCTVSGHVVNVRWVFSNGTITPINTTDTSKYGGSTVSNASLVIYAATFIDSGKYRCIAENGYQTARSQGINVTVQGAPPSVVVSPQTQTVNQGTSVTLHCTVTGSPAPTSLEWKMFGSSGSYVNVPGPFTGGTLDSPLVISSAQMVHSGTYACLGTNDVGTSGGNDVNVVVIGASTTSSSSVTAGTMCPCDCTYKEKLEYWALQEPDNHTIEELREILAPVIEKLEKELKVETANLSSSINKRISAKDSRPSAQSLGMMGVAFLSLVFGGILLIDLTSIPRYADTIKRVCRLGQYR